MKKLEKLKAEIKSNARWPARSDCMKLIAIIEKQNEALEFYADEKSWMITRQDDLHTSKRTIIGDVDSFGVVSEPGLASKLLIVAGQSSRKTLSEVSELLRGLG